MNQTHENDTFQTELLPETDFADIDAELGRMAEETPEMPDSFHSAWTAAVRAEAQAAGKTVNAGTTRKKGEAKRQWRYILSAAAVFVFLITGTVITRMDRNNARNNRNIKPQVSVERVTEVPPGVEAAGAGTEGEAMPFSSAAEEEPAEAAGSAMDEMSAAEEEIIADGDVPIFDESMSMAAEDEAWGDAEEEESEEAEAPAEDSAWESAYEAKEEAAPDMNVNGAVPAEAMKAESAPMAEATAMPMPERTEEPPLTADEPAPMVPAAYQTAEEEQEEQAEEADEEDREGFAGFMKDFGAFTLKALPWLAGAAVLILIVALIRRKAKKK